MKVLVWLSAVSIAFSFVEGSVSYRNRVFAEVGIEGREPTIKTDLIKFHLQTKAWGDAIGIRGGLFNQKPTPDYLDLGISIPIKWKFDFIECGLKAFQKRFGLIVEEEYMFQYNSSETQLNIMLYLFPNIDFKYKASDINIGSQFGIIKNVADRLSFIMFEPQLRSKYRWKNIDNYFTAIVGRKLDFYTISSLSFSNITSYHQVLDAFNIRKLIQDTLYCDTRLEQAVYLTGIEEKSSLAIHFQEGFFFERIQKETDLVYEKTRIWGSASAKGKFEMYSNVNLIIDMGTEFIHYFHNQENNIWLNLEGKLEFLF